MTVLGWTEPRPALDPARRISVVRGKPAGTARQRFKAVDECRAVCAGLTDADDGSGDDGEDASSSYIVACCQPAKMEAGSRLVMPKNPSKTLRPPTTRPQAASRRLCTFTSRGESEAGHEEWARVDDCQEERRRHGGQTDNRRHGEPWRTDHQHCCRWPVRTSLGLPFVSVTEHRDLHSSATAGCRRRIARHRLRDTVCSLPGSPGRSCKAVRPEGDGAGVRQCRRVQRDLYGHLVPEASGRARDALDRAFTLGDSLPMCPAGDIREE